MKKALKWILRILGILLALILIGIIAAVIFFWPFLSSLDWSIVTFDNIKALYRGFTTDSETLITQEKELDDKRAEDIKSYVSVEVRDFTEEELKQIEAGEKTKTEIVAGIIAESVEKEDAASQNEETDEKPDEEPDKTDEAILPDDKAPEDKTPDEKKPEDKTPTVKKESADAIVARHIANLYSIQSNFETRVNNLAAAVKNWTRSYYKSQGCTWKEAKVAAVKHFTSQASQLETDCYNQVDAEIAALEKELRAIGADLSIVKTVKESAYAEMEIKKAKIVNEGNSKLNK